MTPTDTPFTETAHAKINLTLHVTGRRSDGYHLLDSLVVFTSFGDRVTVAPANDLTLTIDGPFAADLSSDADNLVLRAARAFCATRGAAITLTKNLPVASGIGGGSADAAATLRALSRLWSLPLPDGAQQLALGADVPVCMSTQMSRMSGIGENISRLGPAPDLHFLLVNPNVAISTPTVFQDLASKENPAMVGTIPDPTDKNWIKWLASQRNDLERPAQEQSKTIKMALAALASFEGCLLSRMSGSGATCFAIFDDTSNRAKAAAKLKEIHPSWWVIETTTAT